MSLLPKSQQPRDDILCWPLGAAKARAVEAKPDPNAWFDAEARKHPDDKPPKTAKKPNLRELEQAVFEEWLDRTRPSGDVESVQCQWEESDEYAEFLDEHDPAPSEPKEADGQWIEWKGGERPVDAETLILTKNTFGHEVVTKPLPAKLFEWQKESRISAYRLVKQQ